MTSVCHHPGVIMRLLQMTGVQLIILRLTYLNESLGIGAGDVQWERPIADTPLAIVSLNDDFTLRNTLIQ